VLGAAEQALQHGVCWLQLGPRLLRPAVDGRVGEQDDDVGHDALQALWRGTDEAAGCGGRELGHDLQQLLRLLHRCQMRLVDQIHVML
jgi:hypothetical protein